MDDFNLNHDPFDEISRLNSKAYNDGFAEGEISGKKSSFEQGFQIGINTSFSILSELGHFSGQCEMYRLENLDELENLAKTNSIKLAIQICQLIDNFDISNCHSDQFATNLNHIRDKYKQFCSLTNNKTNLNTSSNSSKLNF
jgi:hypothetical protein